ncbi:MAG TPA: DUF1588 domain-containing protein [Polyangiaceae bacterium]|nr:DUF1588 domain-containing protein [Polyangiaceae bacterium]
MPKHTPGRCQLTPSARTAPALRKLSAVSACLALFGCTGLVDGPATDHFAEGSVAGTPPMAASGGGGGGGSTDPTAGGAGSMPASVPGPATLPHLTVSQYHNAIRRVFGAAVIIPELESDDKPDFYAVIGAAREPVSATGVSMFWAAAQSVASQVTQSEVLRAALLPCPAAPRVDEGCIASFLDVTGPRLFRRPLSDDERARYTALIQDTADGDLWQGLRFGLTAMLASPAFLYREERTVADGAVPGGRRFDDYALASRLSFLLINDGPDDELLQTAAKGTLREPQQLAQQLERLYATSVGVGLKQFFSEYLELDNAGLLDFPSSTPANDKLIAAGMRGEVLALARDAIAPGADFRRLFTTRSTYVNGPLAELYGLAGVTGSALAPVTLPESSHRGGLLTTGAFLTAEGAQDRTKPTNRGFYVQVRLMCTRVPDPPDNVPQLDAAGDPVATSVRQVLELHRSQPSCAACHALMDPIGVGMEDFDQFGRYRTAYADGSSVDATSEWNGVPVVGAAALGAELGSDPKVADCVARQLFRYATARRETDAGEGAVIQQLSQAFTQGGYEFKRLVSALIASDSFRYAGSDQEVSP